MKKGSPLIERHRELILFLNSLPKSKRSEFIKLLKRYHINCVSEIFSNFLKGNLTTDKDIIKRVKKYRGVIKKVALKKTPTKEKIKILSSQRGGAILSVLLPLAASVLGGLFSR